MEAGGGLVASVCLPSCLVASLRSGLVAQVPHTCTLTYCTRDVYAVALVRTTVFYI